MRPHDTSEEAHQVQMEAYRRMTPERKIALVFELSETVRELARGGIRQRHPEYTDEDVKRALAVLLYGREVAEKVWVVGNVPSP